MEVIDSYGNVSTISYLLHYTDMSPHGRSEENPMTSLIST
jgi:hypothetical protein